MKTYTFYANAIHCKSCTVLIEENLSEAEGVKSVRADLRTKAVEIVADSDAYPEELAQRLTRHIEKDGYQLSLEPKKDAAEWGDFLYALPIAIVIAALFVILQKAGVTNLINSDAVSYPVAFLIGLVASVSTCLAVVGGLLLSVSANYAREGSASKPQLLFHVGRLIAFFVLGGVIGLAGSAFTLSGSATAALSIIIALVMVVLGLNLLEVFPWAERLMPKMPAIFMRKAAGLRSKQGAVTPFLLGVATFFLPCGFTQSMQLYTLSTGSFFSGALTMTAFALGTLPVLGLISFTSFKLGKGRWSGIFFKTAGILVIAFGLINVLSGLAVMGIIRPVINF